MSAERSVPFYGFAALCLIGSLTTATTLLLQGTDARQSDDSTTKNSAADADDASGLTRSPTVDSFRETEASGKAARSVSKNDAPITESQRLGELTDSQLAALVNDVAAAEAIAKAASLTEKQFESMLMTELARRLQSRQPATNMTDESTAGTPQAKDASHAKDAAHGAALGDKSDEPFEIRIEKVSTRVASDRATGFGFIEVRYAPGHGAIVYPDAPLGLDCPSDRFRYVAFDVAYQDATERSEWQAQTVTAHFLLNGKEPVDVRLLNGESVLLDDYSVDPNRNDAQLDSLQQRWWNAFSRIPRGVGGEERLLRQTINDLLARRYGMPGPWPAIGEGPKDPSGLEEQFERAVSMLFGIESVKLAMQADATLNQTSSNERASQSVPAARRLNSIAIPPFEPRWVEPIAQHVPEECFYLRTGNTANYRYFRGFLTGWGGNLDDIVSNGTLEHKTRERIENQLALDSSAIESVGFDALISDMALIGSDPLFNDGAALGIVFEAKETVSLLKELKRHRQAVLRGNDDATEHRVLVHQHSVSFLSTSDHRVRSFYAVDGDYHLITNSEYLLNRFFEAGSGERSLGHLKEFRYARSKTASARHCLAFLYLSDPFFQHLVSPRYRIEMNRRYRAKVELQQLRMARQLATSEGVDAHSIEQLIDEKYLPAAFANRPDGSRPTLVDGSYLDSLRGLPGTFLPVADVPVEKATRSEITGYYAFLRAYNRQWKRVDPVTVVFERTDSEDDSVDCVRLDIYITPYARERYALLEQHLAGRTRKRMVFDDGNLLSVDAAVRMGNGMPTHLLSIGLRDDRVAYDVENGGVVLRNIEDGKSFAATRSYVALTPPSTALLQRLASILFKGEGITAPAPKKRAITSSPPPLPASVPLVGRALYYFGWGLRRLPSAKVAKYVSWIETRDSLLIASASKSIRNELFNQLSEEWAERPTKVHMQVGNLKGSKVEPYIQAYTFMQARRQSAMQSQLLNDVSRWMRLPPHEARSLVEATMDANVRCPLGGQYGAETIGTFTHWSSSAWKQPSAFSITEVPEPWRFAFLDWLRGMTLYFDLGDSTLHAEIELKVQRTDVGQADGQSVALKMNGPAPSRKTVPVAVVGLARPEISARAFEAAPVSRNAGIRDEGNRWTLGINILRNSNEFRVDDVYPGSPAFRHGIQVGDRIVRVNGEMPNSVTNLARLIRQARGRGLAAIDLRRRNTRLHIRVPLNR